VRALAAVRTRLATLLAVNSVGQAVDQLAGGLDSSADSGHAGDGDGLGVLTHDDVLGVGCWLCLVERLMCVCVGSRG
jgi:hypothetical protein